MSALQVAGPTLLTKIAVDRYMAPVPGQAISSIDRWFPQDRLAGIAAVSIAYLLVLVLIAVFDFTQSYLMQWTGQRAMSDLRKEMMRRLQALDVEFFDRNPVGRLVTRVTSDVDALNDVFTSGVVSIMGDLFMLILIVVAMFQPLSPQLTALVLAVTPLIVIATMKFGQAASHSYRLMRITVARINAASSPSTSTA